jgi:hypothetical protein
LSVSASSLHSLSSAAFITNIAESDFRYAHVKNTIGRLLGLYWQLYEHAPKVRATISEGNQIEPERFARAVDRVIAGEQGAAVLEDDFVSAYAVAGELDDCVEQCRALHRSGVTELALSLVGHDPAAEMRRFAEVLWS